MLSQIASVWDQVDTGEASVLGVFEIASNRGFCLMTIQQRDNQNYEKSCDNCATTPTNIEFQK